MEMQITHSKEGESKRKEPGTGVNPGDQEDRYEGKDSVCFVPGNRNCQQKLEEAS